MSPIIEMRVENRPGRRNSPRNFLVCRHPDSGGVICRRMLGSTLTKEEIFERTIAFTYKWTLIFEKSFGRVMSRCEDVLL